jgi:hypothetical protein
MTGTRARRQGSVSSLALCECESWTVLGFLWETIKICYYCAEDLFSAQIMLKACYIH